MNGRPLGQKFAAGLFDANVSVGYSGTTVTCHYRSSCWRALLADQRHVKSAAGGIHARRAGVCWATGMSQRWFPKEKRHFAEVSG